MNQFDMEMATTNRRLDQVERIGKVKMKMLKYMDEDGYVESHKPGMGVAICLLIGLIVAPTLITLLLIYSDEIDKIFNALTQSFLKWLFL